MRRLSGTDALFLSMETPAWHQHIGALLVLDPTDVPGWGLDRAHELLAARVGSVPKLRWKLKEVPFGLDRPVWVDDGHFDLARHVHRVGVPRPGGRRELGELFGQIMSRQLDRNLPLWECWFIDGLEHDQVATVLKFHHAVLDGAAGAALATVLLDTDPGAPYLSRRP